MLLLSLFVALAASRAVTFDEYSATMTDPTGASPYSVSMIKDPTTGSLQPIILVNSSYYTYVGGLKSYIGGVGMYYSASGAFSTVTQGSRLLEAFDFSSNGWLRYPSTVVSKTAQGTTTYSRNCTRSFLCVYPVATNINSYAGGVLTLEVDRRGTPMFLNASYPTSSSFIFTGFSQTADTYGPDDSAYVLPASAYNQTAQPAPNITTFSFFRSAANDSYIRNILNDNVATPPGEANWAGCQSNTSTLVYVRFDVQIDQNFVYYAFCNGGSCPTNTVAQKIGIEPPYGSPVSFPNAWWFSIPQAARCARGFPIGTNNCTLAHSIKLVKAVSAACFVNSVAQDPNLSGMGPSALCTGNLTAIGAHIEATLDPNNPLCPDISATLPPLPDDL